MPMNQTGFNDIKWNELEALVNQYCNQTQSGLGSSFNNYNYTSIPVDWDAFYAEWEQGPQDLTQFNKSDLNVWINNYNEFINAGGESIMV